jgi:TetR/AcrR family transcriptional regulator, ethionamide resistance regulator
VAAPSRTRTRHRVEREAARRRILDAAERLLRERPYRDLTVEDVMAGAGLSRTVFYRHFDDLPKLMMSLLDTVQGELEEAMKLTVDAPGDWEAFIDTLRGAVDVWDRHGPLMRAIVDAGSYDEEIDEAYRAVRDGWVDLSAQLLARDVEAGRLAPVNTAELARALTVLNEAYLMETLGRVPRLAEPGDALETLVLVWTRTLLPADNLGPNAPTPERRP